MKGNLYFKKQKEEKGPAKTMPPQLKRNSIVSLGPFSELLDRNFLGQRGWKNFSNPICNILNFKAMSAYCDVATTYYT